MAKPSSKRRTKKVEDYEHKGATRLNNPPSGLAWQDTEKPPKRKFEYDPHLDPQLVWSGKTERTSFEVEAPSIHVHEWLSAENIIRTVQKEQPQLSFWENPDFDRSKQVAFYQHEMDWYNRLVLGDSLVVLTSLLEKERLGGQVGMIYLDPPYGIGYNSNFQPRISSRTVKDRSDEHLTREPEQIQAFRDTWELGVHSYLTYLRDRLLVGRELLGDTGSIFVQIGEDNVHLVRTLMDEVFGPENFCSLIPFRKKLPMRSTMLPSLYDYVLWYAKNRPRAAEKFRRIFVSREIGEGTPYTWIELPDGSRRKMAPEERANPKQLPKGSRPFQLILLTSAGRTESCVFEFELEGKKFQPAGRNSWKTTPDGMQRLIKERRVMVAGNTPRYVFYFDDYPVQELGNVWSDTQGAVDLVYVVQTSTKVVERCLLMATDPGDLVVDPTAGSGTTCHVAEQWGRRWVGIDTSRVAVSLARERLLTSVFPYYALVDEMRGVGGGFRYREAKHVTMGSITQGREPSTETLYDRPETDTSKIRVCGPFTVEALSRYSANPFQPDAMPDHSDDAAEARDHVKALLDALRKQGIPGKGGKPATITSLEPIANAGFLQAEGSYQVGDGGIQSFAVSVGPRFGPITVNQIDDALHDAYGYNLVLFVGFAATAEAQKYLAPGRLGKFDVALVEANPDLLVDDLLKTTSKSQTFRLFSSPEVKVKKVGKGQVAVEVIGLDSFDALTGEVISRDQGDIAAWFLDQDYDGIVFHVTQAFLPRTDGWQQLQKALKEVVNEDLMEQLRSFESLPFTKGKNGRAAVRVIDDSGSTSEAILDLL